MTLNTVEYQELCDTLASNVVNCELSTEETRR